MSRIASLLFVSIRLSIQRRTFNLIAHYITCHWAMRPSKEFFVFHFQSIRPLRLWQTQCDDNAQCGATQSALWTLSRRYSISGWQASNFIINPIFCVNFHVEAFEASVSSVALLFDYEATLTTNLFERIEFKAFKILMESVTL